MHRCIRNKVANMDATAAEKNGRSARAWQSRDDPRSDWLAGALAQQAGDHGDLAGVPNGVLHNSFQ